MDKQKLVKIYPALTGLCDTDLELLLQPNSIIQVPANTELFAEHQPCRGFPLILQGSIKVIKQSSNGREIMLYRVAAGGSCIISSSCLLGNNAYNAKGITESSVFLLILPTALFSKCIVETPTFRDFIFNLFSERIANLMQLVEEVAFSRLDKRLAKHLSCMPAGTIFITHQQLASELGSVREIISRLLKSFVSQGLLSLSREQITIIDRAGLEKLASM